MEKDVTAAKVSPTSGKAHAKLRALFSFAKQEKRHGKKRSGERMGCASKRKGEKKAEKREQKKGEKSEERGSMRNEKRARKGGA